MSNPVTVIFRDGRKQQFPDNGRAGGSYQQSVQYHEGGFVSIVDVWNQVTTFPYDVIQEIRQCPTRY